MNLARLLFLAVYLTGSTAMARPQFLLGWENGNAGDMYGAEFVATGRDLIGRLRYMSPSSLQGVDLNVLNNIVLGTTIRSQDHVSLDGREVDAANYPAFSLIVVSRTRWKEYRDPSQARNRFLLVLHEYLTVMAANGPTHDKNFDLNYRVSNALIALVPLDAESSTAHWWTPLNPVNTILLDLVYNPANCGIAPVAVTSEKGQETFTVPIPQECVSTVQTINIEKSSSTAPADSGFRGTFNKYTITVFSVDGGAQVGTVEYEPEWGKCLLPQDGTCRLSGSIQVGGVKFAFWFLRK